MLLISYICLTRKEILNLEFKKLSLRSVSSSDRRCYCNSDSMYFSHTVGYLEPRSTRQYVHLCDCLHDTEITELFTEQILLGGGLEVSRCKSTEHLRRVHVHVAYFDVALQTPQDSTTGSFGFWNIFVANCPNLSRTFQDRSRRHCGSGSISCLCNWILFLLNLAGN